MSRDVVDLEAPDRHRHIIRGDVERWTFISERVQNITRKLGGQGLRQVVRLVRIATGLVTKDRHATTSCKARKIGRQAQVEEFTRQRAAARSGVGREVGPTARTL
ncbi:unnamed protein product [Ectocarpus sp. CCAP 1310/34]|nr:unnamed protein product [Ectocarpus sp. CCAP 1310/34]